MKLAFSPTLPQFTKNPSIEAFRYWEGMDWDRVMTHYAIIDPMDPRAVQYLTEQDYIRLTRVALTMETTIRVIARPGDEPPHDYDIKKSPTLNKISPLVRADFLQSRYWRSTLSQLIDLKDTMVVIHPGKLDRIVRRYSILLSAYSGVRLSPTLLTAVTSFCINSRNFMRSQGIKRYIIRLKITKLILEKYLAGDTSDTAELRSGIIRLSKGGLPCWLPLLARQAFLNRSIPQIRFWLSILNMYRAFLGPYEDPDFSSIASPRPEIPLEDLQSFENFMREFSRKYGLIGDVKDLCPRRFPILTNASGVCPGQSIFSSGTAVRLWGLQPVNHLLNWLTLVGDDRGRQMYNLLYKLNRPWSDWIRTRWRSRTELFLGRLHLKYEPAGKIRVFAMVDYFTQYAMLPMHEKMFSFLKVFGEADATFNQNAAVQSFSGTCKEYFSYDLKSATDLISLDLYIRMISVMFGKEVAKCWSLLLTDRDFGLPVKGNPSSREFYSYDNKKHIRYTRGQPMGALSSWASLALVHHMLVQYASFKVTGEVTLFSQYRVLGDDIVIGCSQVASEYLKICESFSVPIGLAKSVVSPATDVVGKKSARLFQFANQIAYGSENISPLSLKEEVQSNSLSSRLELISKLVDRGWHTHKNRKILSFYLRGLNPTRWSLGLPLFRVGRVPLFVEALLPILLSPMSKDIGLTGLSKYHAWYQVLTGSYNFANLLNHKFWLSDKHLIKNESFIKFLSERARDIYRDTLTRQSWYGQEEKKDSLLADLPQSSRYTDWWIPFTDHYLSIDSSVPPEFVNSVDLKDIVSDWLSGTRTRGKGEMLAWETYKESAVPLLSVEYKTSDGKTRKKNINLNFTNFPLVKQALEDYHLLVKETLSPLLKMAPPRKSREHDYVPSIFVFRVKNGVPQGSWIPRADAIPRGLVFALLTEGQYKGKAFDQSWDWKEPLHPAVRAPNSLPDTFQRLEEMLSIQKLYDLMTPTDMLKKIILPSPPTGGYSHFLTKMLSNAGSIGLKRHLFLIKEKIVPSLLVR
jgi:hypothetical protein